MAEADQRLVFFGVRGKTNAALKDNSFVFFVWRRSERGGGGGGERRPVASSRGFRSPAAVSRVSNGRDAAGIVAQ